MKLINKKIRNQKSILEQKALYPQMLNNSVTDKFVPINLGESHKHIKDEKPQRHTPCSSSVLHFQSRCPRPGRWPDRGCQSLSGEGGAAPVGELRPRAGGQSLSGRRLPHGGRLVRGSEPQQGGVGAPAQAWEGRHSYTTSKHLPPKRLPITKGRSNFPGETHRHPLHQVMKATIINDMTDRQTL